MEWEYIELWGLMYSECSRYGGSLLLFTLLQSKLLVPTLGCPLGPFLWELVKLSASLDLQWSLRWQSSPDKACRPSFPLHPLLQVLLAYLEMLWKLNIHVWLCPLRKCSHFSSIHSFIPQTQSTPHILATEHVTMNKSVKMSQTWGNLRDIDANFVYIW